MIEILIPPFAFIWLSFLLGFLFGVFVTVLDFSKKIFRKEK